jgi:hypothetical protein
MSQSNVLSADVSRRSFLRLAGVAAASLPILTEAHFAAAAMQPQQSQQLKPGTRRIRTAPTSSPSCSPSA